MTPNFQTIQARIWCSAAGRVWHVVVEGKEFVVVKGDPRDETLALGCKRCGAVSYNPNDIQHRYCGRCHEFFD